MKGAREYAPLFKTGRHGRLWIISGEHARGKTFHIYVLPRLNVSPESLRHTDGVEVYGVTGGNPGWTEHYGWLHQGRWQNDFYALVEMRKVEMARQDAASKEDAEAKKNAKDVRQQEILSSY